MAMATIPRHARSAAARSTEPAVCSHPGASTTAGHDPSGEKSFGR
jgi:hypothetical protein